MLSTAMSISYNRTLEQKLTDSSVAVQLHGELFEAIRKRDAHTARELAKELITNAITKILSDKELLHLINNLH